MGYWCGDRRETSLTAPVTGGAGPAYAGTLAGIAAGHLYDDSRGDQMFDAAVDDYFVPGVAKTIDGGIALGNHMYDGVAAGGRYVATRRRRPMMLLKTRLKTGMII